MFTSVLLAILISAAPADEASASPELQRVSIGNMSFQGDEMIFTKSENGAFECDIEGKSRVSIGSDVDNNITITAQNIIIASDRNSKITIRCTGDCRFSDSEHICSADRMEIQFNKQLSLQLFGGCRVQYGSGKERTVLAGDSIIFENGKFRVSGAASLQLAQ